MKIVVKIFWIPMLCLLVSGCAEIAQGIYDPQLEKDIKGRYMIHRNESGIATNHITFPSSASCRGALRETRKYTKKPNQWRCEEFDDSKALPYRGAFACIACPYHVKVATDTLSLCTEQLDVFAQEVKIKYPQHVLEFETTARCRKE